MSKRNLAKVPSTRKGGPSSPTASSSANEGLTHTTEAEEQDRCAANPTSSVGVLLQAAAANVNSENTSRASSPRGNALGAGVSGPAVSPKDESLVHPPPPTKSKLERTPSMLERTPSMLVKKRRVTSPPPEEDAPKTLVSTAMNNLQSVQDALDDARAQVVAANAERQTLLDSIERAHKESTALSQLAQEYRAGKAAADRELAKLHASSTHHHTELKELRQAAKRSEKLLEQANAECKHLREVLRSPPPCQYCSLAREEGDKFRKQNKELRHIIAQMEDEERRHVPLSERVRPLTKTNVFMKQQNAELLQKVADLSEKERMWGREKAQLESTVKQLQVQVTRAAAQEHRVMELEVQNQLLLSMVQKEKSKKHHLAAASPSAPPSSSVPRGNGVPGGRQHVGGVAAQRPPRVLPPIIEAKVLDQVPPKIAYGNVRVDKRPPSTGSVDGPTTAQPAERTHVGRKSTSSSRVSSVSSIHRRSSDVDVDDIEANMAQTGCDGEQRAPASASPCSTESSRSSAHPVEPVEHHADDGSAVPHDDEGAACRRDPPSATSSVRSRRESPLASAPSSRPSSSRHSSPPVSSRSSSSKGAVEPHTQESGAPPDTEDNIDAAGTEAQDAHSAEQPAQLVAELTPTASGSVADAPVTTLSTSIDASLVVDDHTGAEPEERGQLPNVEGSIDLPWDGEDDITTISKPTALNVAQPGGTQSPVASSGTPPHAEDGAVVVVVNSSAAHAQQQQQQHDTQDEPSWLDD